MLMFYLQYYVFLYETDRKNSYETINLLINYQDAANSGSVWIYTKSPKWKCKLTAVLRLFFDVLGLHVED